jgi:methylated-DNA-[protein]-cysteine S-methyltransferase
VGARILRPVLGRGALGCIVPVHPRHRPAARAGAAHGGLASARLKDRARAERRPPLHPGRLCPNPRDRLAGNDPRGHESTVVAYLLYVRRGGAARPEVPRRPAPRVPRGGLKRESLALSRDEDRTAAAREQLVEYFAGERRSFDLPVARRSSDFQEAAWEGISRIPIGEMRTYGQVAKAIGRPGEAVKVGISSAANPVLLVVPCHREVGANGSVKGYAGGVRLKERLLDFEANRQPTAA